MRRNDIQHLGTLISDPKEIRGVFERFVLPRLALRDRYLEDAEQRFSKLIEYLQEPGMSEASFSGAPQALVTRMTTLGLNPKAVLIAQDTQPTVAYELYMPLLSITRKTRIGMSFSTFAEEQFFYNETVGDYLLDLLADTPDTEVAKNIKQFITRAHYARAGAGWDGDSRNLGGRVTLVNLQRSIINALDTLELPWKAFLGGGTRNEAVTGLSVMELDPASSATTVRRFVVDERMEISFGEPDYKVRALTGSKSLIAVGEIKGRTDLSNLYESWLPTIQKKLEKYQKRPIQRLIFQMFITREMLGDPGRAEAGLQDMLSSGLATGVYSLIKLDTLPSEQARLVELLKDHLSHC